MIIKLIVFLGTIIIITFILLASNAEQLKKSTDFVKISELKNVLDENFNFQLIIMLA